MGKTEPSPVYPGVATKVYQCISGARIVVEGSSADLRAAGFIDESTPIPRSKQGSYRFGDGLGLGRGDRSKISMFGNGLLRVNMPMECNRQVNNRIHSNVIDFNEALARRNR